MSSIAGILTNWKTTLIGLVPLLLQSLVSSGVLNTSAAPGWITSLVVAALGAVAKDFDVHSTTAQVQQATKVAQS